MKTQTDIEILKKELKYFVRETIQEEMMKIRAELIPFISEKEQKEIESLYDKPSTKTI
ncbi:MAG: hypothetical protein ISS16_12010 [Ignavibacteria bacterium]|nr:hypothetical protein [Ignavibacteria bacterium]